jgi:hypothetical protein
LLTPRPLPPLPPPQPPPSLLLPSPVTVYILWRIYACKNCNNETRSRDYAVVEEAVYSPCRAEDSRPVPSRAEPIQPWTSRQATAVNTLDDAGRGAVT